MSINRISIIQKNCNDLELQMLNRIIEWANRQEGSAKSLAPAVRALMDKSYQINNSSGSCEIIKSNQVKAIIN